MHAQFDLLMPTAFDEALDVLAEDGECMPLAGGTNVLVDLRARAIAPKTLMSLGKLADLRLIEATDAQVILGGGSTVSDILRHPDMGRFGASLSAAADVFAGQMVRNTATVAGNICCGSPAADLVPPLLVLDAQVTLHSTRGTREVPLAEFFIDYKQNVRAPDELLTRVVWPKPPSNSADLFHKLARRKGDAVTVVGIAVALTLDGDKCRRARIALGAVAPTVKRATRAESMLEGETLTPALIEAAARQAADAGSPIDDVRATGEYRRHGVHVLTRRLLNQAWEKLSRGTRP
jgi:carbon-monoxide dehydrogenase medium subunit